MFRSKFKSALARAKLTHWGFFSDIDTPEELIRAYIDVREKFGRVSDELAKHNKQAEPPAANHQRIDASEPTYLDLYDEGGSSGLGKKRNKPSVALNDDDEEKKRRRRDEEDYERRRRSEESMATASRTVSSSIFSAPG